MVYGIGQWSASECPSYDVELAAALTKAPRQELRDEPETMQ